jgi:hypothetical protein
MGELGHQRARRRCKERVLQLFSTGFGMFFFSLLLLLLLLLLLSLAHSRLFKRSLFISSVNKIAQSETQLYAAIDDETKIRSQQH